MTKKLSIPILIALIFSGCVISYKFNGASIDYTKTKSIAIADIDSSKTMMINCEVNQFTNNYHAYRFDDEVEGSGVGRAYLIDCTALQKRTLSIEGTEDFNVQVKNFHGNYENSDLNISLYEE